MNKADLERMADRYQAKADRAYQNLLGSNSTGATAEAKARDILTDLVATASVYNLIRKE